jgi:hypothetical protein
VQSSIVVNRFCNKEIISKKQRNYHKFLMPEACSQQLEARS